VLPPRPMLVIAPENATDLWTIGGRLRGDQCAMGIMRLESPLLHGLAMHEVLIDEAVQWQWRESGESLLATAAGEPLYGRLDRPTGPVLLLGIDPRKSDLALRSDFSQFVGNAIRGLTPPASQPRAAFRTSDVATFGPEEVGRRLVTPAGEAISLGETPTVIALAQTGLWQLTTDDTLEPAATLASNLANARESNLQPPAGLRAVELQLLRLPRESPLWMLLIGMAVVLLVADACLFHRRLVE
jgi:hypothetical protein